MAQTAIVPFNVMIAMQWNKVPELRETRQAVEDACTSLVLGLDQDACMRLAGLAVERLMNMQLVLKFARAEPWFGWQAHNQVIDCLWFLSEHGWPYDQRLQLAVNIRIYLDTLGYWMVS